MTAASGTPPVRPSPAPRPLKRDELDARRFPETLCDRLFAAVLVDDEIDDDLCLPDAVQVDLTPEQLVDCFRLCRQLWIEGFDRETLVRQVGILVREHDLAPDDRLRLKHIRAKFKHFRYAHALYDASHRYPPMLDRVTITMGQVQDAYRNHRGGAVALRAAMLRLMLTGPAVRRLRSEGDRLRPATPADFRTRLAADLAVLEALVARPTVTGHAFHAARKVIGRQVSFWDTLRTLEPTEDRFRLSRWLSAINGEMGALHDRLVERRAENRASYATAFTLPEAVRQRIDALNGRMRVALRPERPRPRR